MVESDCLETAGMPTRSQKHPPLGVAAVSRDWMRGQTEDLDRANNDKII